MIVFLQGATQLGSELLRKALQKVNVPNIEEKHVFSLKELRVLLNQFKYWSIKSRYEEGQVVTLSLINFVKVEQGETIMVYFDLSFPNSYIVVDNVCSNLVLNRCTQQTKILQKISSAPAKKNKDMRRQSFQIQSTSLQNLPIESRGDQFVPAKQKFMIQSYNDESLSIVVMPFMKSIYETQRQNHNPS
jgi:hypothetical protein